MQPVTDLDIVFISYDEPMADDLFDHLTRISRRRPIRVHGVKGFDNALKAAARMATTDRFITVDGDNRVRESFFWSVIDPAHDDLVLSYNARSVLTGLAYGNGSIKIWPRELVLKLNTHENAEGGGNDFCWTYRYWQIDEIASDVNHAQSPFHAFRSAYREAVKLSLIRDNKAASWDIAVANMYPPNLSRLLVWMSVGIDQPNGEWSVYGARLGWHDLWIGNIDPNHISDYDWLKNRFNTVRISTVELSDDIANAWMLMPDLDPAASKWFKAAYINPPRAGIMLSDMKPPL